MKLTPREVAEWLSVPENTVYDWLESGVLPSIRVSDLHVINSTELLEWARRNGRALSEKARLAGADTLAELSDALVRGGVHRSPDAVTREAVLTAIVEKLDVAPDERPLIHDIVMAREFIGSTGIGEGIAIPHVRMPIVTQVGGNALALWYLDHKVDFRSADGKAIDTVFFLVTSTPRAHLHLLGRLAAALHDQGFRRVLASRGDLAAVRTELKRLEARAPPSGR